MNDGGLQLALVFLLAGVVAVPVFKRLGLGAVLAYLVAGALLGPHGFGFVRDAERILNASEVGVVMLLFVIGLELSPSRLKVMRKPVFGTGGLQVLLTTLVLGALCLRLGLSWKKALVIGMGLALSSTAVSLQLLAERKALATDYGRTGFAVLLFQDLAAIPLLVAIPLLGGAKNQTLSWATGLEAIGAIVLVALFGRLALRHLFRIVARTRMPEVFTASALLVVLGTAWLMQLAGLSAGLGAFLAGVLLSDSEFRHELESQIEPFKSLLLGLFFIAVGMSIDIDRVRAEPQIIAAGVLTLLLVKAGVLLALGRWQVRLSWRAALKLGAVLWLGGEFAFVVFNQAAQADLLSGQQRDRLVAMVGLSMAATPLLLIAASRWLDHAPAAPKRAFEEVEDLQPRVLIAGMGRFGQIVARLLTAQRVSFVALEHSAEQVDTLRRFGNARLFYGDPTRPDLLRAAGAQHCKVFVVAMDDPDTNIRCTRLIRRMYPAATVLSRARNRQHAWRLMDLSAEPFRETFGSSLEMGERVLTALGVDEEEAARQAQRFRAHDEKLLREQYLVYDDDAALIQTARDARRDLEKLVAADTAPPATADTSASATTDKPAASD
ncbi:MULTISPECIES: monovalent cation:proton antiporter-2 (CPA2) family protein [Pseudoxanthomonas]|uniref:Glutathione-regulated potassium-efflux system protein KefB n=1 Tax=Pseudoxanthomonas winnipegensis TaxID=2480810 RepID=A0AAW8GGM7_9GAMM|nr:MULTISPECIES: monovalent cation:proton antiporter-2 (CPA2) family protein [Pseudoxanthomonas]MDQ1121325.1 glutathione-regulated potassium-efflux system protein KefB [Pseudoxanthomonas winnipegensis]MDQ1134559.1 glutathione-regulated potassium-efflux system protein KefB [Pseudoxanthomonas winnipegensis]MDR6139212.1 glutathione-regulated potassium-efflux system protein KefB [Pseudoxanthomonas sp. SORGH_AS_0997]